MNEATKLGVSAINAQNQANVEGKAIALINDILRLQDCVTKLEVDIKEYQESLNKLQIPEVNEKAIIGAALPPAESQNLNQQTIAKAILALQKSNQSNVERISTRLTEAVLASRADIAACEKEIAKKRDELSKLAVEVVTPEAVVGE